MNANKRRLRSPGKALLLPAVLLLVVMFVVPIFGLVPTSLEGHAADAGVSNPLIPANYASFVLDPYYRRILGHTAFVGVVTTVITLLLGYPVAYFLARTRSRWRSWLRILIIFPLLLNVVARTFGWMIILSNHGVINDFLMWLGLVSQPVRLMYNMVGILIGLVHIFLPFMILVLMSSIQTIPREVEEAARTLGSNWGSTFLRVTLPLSAPGIFSGSILVFVLAISALVTPLLLGGPTYKLMSTLIYDEFLVVVNWPAGSAMAILLTIVVIATIGFYSRIARRFGVRS